MSQLNAELTEQAAELGFHSIEEAEINGYEVDYIKGELVEGQELAHENWLKRKAKIIDELVKLRDSYAGVEHTTDVISNTITFIRDGEI